MSGRWSPKSPCGKPSKATSISRQSHRPLASLTAPPVLRTAKHAPFHWRSRCEGLLGQTIGAQAGPAVGRIETSSSYKVSHGDGRALELSGFAERNGVGAECIVLVDGTHTAIGAGAPVVSGWKGVAMSPKGTAGLRTCPLCGRE